MEEHGIPVAAAALRLGITTDALRKRVERGQAQGYHRKNRLYVVLPDEPAPMPVATPDSGPDTSRHDMDTVETMRLRTRLDATEEQVGFLRGQLVEKDRQLAAREREVQELHVMLQTAQRQLPATVDAPESPVRSGEAAAPPTMPNTSQGVPQSAQDGLLKRIIRAVMGGH